MKRILLAVSCITTTTIATPSIVGCSPISDGGGNLPPFPPSPDPKPDINDYQQEIAKCQQEIINVKNDLKTLNSKASKIAICGSDSMCQNLIQIISDVKAGLIDYQVTVQVDQYQILMLRTHQLPNPDEKKLAIKYLKQAIKLLKQRKIIMQRSPDFKPIDYQNISKAIMTYQAWIKQLTPTKTIEN